ncbi:MAG: HAD-IB family phosphatase, partial [Actinomycetota bacterium]
MDGTLLAILSGRDRPGVTTALLDSLRHTRTVVLDMEQLVVRGRLILAVLLGVGAHDVGDVRAIVHEVAARVGMEVETVPGANEVVAARRGRIHVTVIGSPLPPGAVADLTRELADRGWNIDRIRRIASYPVTAVVFEASGDEDVVGLRRALAERSRALGVDVAVQHAGLDRRGQRRIVMDVDSTVIQDEVIDLLAAAAGQGDAVAQITEKAMHGDLDFADSLRLRVAALEGLPESALAEVAQAVTLTPGARTLCRTLKRLGFHVCLVSGGFEEVVVPVTSALDVDRIRANRL